MTKDLVRAMAKLAGNLERQVRIAFEGRAAVEMEELEREMVHEMVEYARSQRPVPVPPPRKGREGLT